MTPEEAKAREIVEPFAKKYCVIKDVQDEVESAFAQGLREWGEKIVRYVLEISEDKCPCGGRGPDMGCPACDIYHAIKGMKNGRP